MTPIPLPIKRIMMDSLRLYFAPLTGAFRGVKAEFQRLDREMERRRKDEREAHRARTA